MRIETRAPWQLPSGGSSSEAGEETVSLVGAAGGTASFVPATSPSRKTCGDWCRRSSAYGRLDYAYNNAGVAQTPALIEDLDESEWARVIGVNLTGVFLCMKYEMRRMVAQGEGGAIVNASSSAGMKAFNRVSSYTASKFGLIGMSREVVRDSTPSGIRVNVVSPSTTDSPMLLKNPDTAERLRQSTPIGRLGDPRELAEAVVWLCSDAASYVTGAVLPVDGGMTA